MTPKDIFERYLLLGEDITLGFDSRKQFIAFKSQLHTARWRENQVAVKLGLPALTEGTEIVATVLSESPLQVKFSLQQKKPKVASFTIIG